MRHPFNTRRGEARSNWNLKFECLLCLSFRSLSPEWNLETKNGLMNLKQLF